MKVLLSILALFAWIASSGCVATKTWSTDPREASSGSVEWDAQQKRLKQAYEDGKQIAETELREQRATIFEGGLLARSINQETGLLITGTGCIVTEADRAREVGHNDRIMQEIRRTGLPSYSRKPWVSEILAPADYFRERSKIETPKTLQPDGAAATSPDDKHTLSLLSSGATPPLGSERSVLISCPSGKKAAALWKTAADPIEFFFGADGSDVAFFRCANRRSGDAWKDQWPFFYAVLDLRTGQWLTMRYEKE